MHVGVDPDTTIFRFSTHDVCINRRFETHLVMLRESAIVEERGTEMMMRMMMRMMRMMMMTMVTMVMKKKLKNKRKKKKGRRRRKQSHHDCMLHQGPDQQVTVPLPSLP